MAPSPVGERASPTTTHDFMTWIDVPNGPDGETPARRLKEDSSTGLHGITNGGVVPIAAEVGQVFASIHAKAEALGRTHATLALAKMRTVPNSEPSMKYSIYPMVLFCQAPKRREVPSPRPGPLRSPLWDQTVGIGFPLPQRLPPVTAFVFMPVRDIGAT